MRPGPAERLSLTGESDTGLVLTYSVSRSMREFPGLLVQQIRVSNHYEPGQWKELVRIRDAVKKVRRRATYGLKTLISGRHSNHQTKRPEVRDCLCLDQLHSRGELESCSVCMFLLTYHLPGQDEVCHR